MIEALHLHPALSERLDRECARQDRMRGDVVHQALEIGLVWMGRELPLHDASKVPSNFGPRESFSRKIIKIADDLVVGDCAVVDARNIAALLATEFDTIQRVLLDMHSNHRALNSDGILVIAAPVVAALKQHERTVDCAEFQRAAKRKIEAKYRARRRPNDEALVAAACAAKSKAAKEKWAEQALQRAALKSEQSALRTAQIAEAKRMREETTQLRIAARLAATVRAAAEKAAAKLKRDTACKSAMQLRLQNKVQAREAKIVSPTKNAPGLKPEDSSNSNIKYILGLRGSRDENIARGLRSKLPHMRTKALTQLANIAAEKERQSSAVELAIAFLRRKGDYCGRMTIYDPKNPNFYINNSRDLTQGEFIARAIKKGWQAPQEIAA
jgi:hypothetical protein